MKGIFLILINLIIIFCSDEIKINKSFKSYKNLRYLESISTTFITTGPQSSSSTNNNAVSITTNNNAVSITTNNNAVPITTNNNAVSITTNNKAVPITTNNNAVPITTNNNAVPITTVIKTETGSNSIFTSSTGLKSNLKTILSTVPNNTIESEPEKILLGVDNYKFENNIIFFYAKFLIESIKKFNPIEIFILAINNNNLRFLQNTPINVECYYVKNISTIYEYHCNKSYDGTIDSIKVSYEGDKTDYAVYSLENLQKQTGDRISLDLIHINDCTIVDEDNAIINGNSEDKTIPNNANSIMYVLIDGSTQNVSTNFIKKDENGNYDLKLNLKQSLSTDLDNKLGVVEINGENKNYLLSFKDDEKSELNYKYDSPNSTTNQVFYPKKSSGGLSGGTIVAIILPCIAALLAVIGLVFFLGKSSAGAAAASTIPMENMGNNTIGVTSSSNVVNKYP